MSKKPKKKTAELVKEPGWDTDNNNKKIDNAKNVRTGLKALGIKLAWNELTNQVLVNDEPVGEDDIFNDLLIDFLDEHGYAPKERIWERTIGHTARKNRTHPIKDYLAGLKWDKMERVEDWLHMYLGADDTPFNRAIGKLFLVAAVRRIMQPGVKFDEMLILEGEQGSEKSTALQILAVKEEWFSDSLPLGASSKVFIELCTGKWIIEIPELAGIGKRDVEHIKATLSATQDRSRLAYGRITVNRKRTCVFAGTTNSDKYLRDQTGNRRYWPVATRQINLDDLRRDRDQLWAEAVVLEAAGESIRLDPALYAAAKVQADRTSEEPYREELGLILDTPGTEGKSIKIKATDIWRFLGIEIGRRTQDQNDRVGAAMKFHGFTRKNASIKGRGQGAYTRHVATDGKDAILIRWKVEPGDRAQDGEWVASTKAEKPKEGDIPF